MYSLMSLTSNLYTNLYTVVFIRCIHWYRSTEHYLCKIPPHALSPPLDDIKYLLAFFGIC